MVDTDCLYFLSFLFIKYDHIILSILYSLTSYNVWISRAKEWQKDTDLQVFRLDNSVLMVEAFMFHKCKNIQYIICHIEVCNAKQVPQSEIQNYIPEVYGWIGKP